ncbi:MAG: hypothetical protein V4527_18300 [Pseudomonadota bacterium]
MSAATEAEIDAGCDAMDAYLRAEELVPANAESWREIGEQKPEQLVSLRSMIAAILNSRGDRP